MLRFCVLLTLILLLPHAGHAASSSVWWQDWEIRSSEELSQGEKYQSYPVHRLFDGDPKTAWVYSATSKEWDTEDWTMRYGIKLAPEVPVRIDGLRLMNGHNLSSERYFKNNRAAEIQVDAVTSKGRWSRKFSLPDRLGWHTLKLPHTVIHSLRLQFPRLRKGPANDLCLSELQLTQGGKPIDMKLPRLVMALDGTEGCTGAELMNINGKVLAYVSYAIGNFEYSSVDGRYVGGYQGEDKNFWVADVYSGKIQWSDKPFKQIKENIVQVRFNHGDRNKIIQLENNIVVGD